MPWSRHTIWRQGSVLTQTDFESAGLTNTGDENLAIAISHDCDIANDNLDIEPSIEFIFARILDSCNGNFTYGKNPRILHVDYKHDDKIVWIEILSSRKIKVQKQSLEQISPGQTYSLVSHQTLQSWLALRYRRLALPNSLVDRLRPVSDYIEKKCKQNASGILSFRLSYEPKEELPPEDIYELWLRIIYVSDKTEYATMAEEISQSLNTEFKTLLNKTKEIGKVELRQCTAVSEMEFTLRDMRDTVEYNFEHLSYRTNPTGPVI
jgi:hypothetical protein